MVAKKQSEDLVFNHIKNHPGDSTERVKLGLINELSNNPINAALKSLEKKGLIKNARTNRRENRWVLAMDNALVSILSHLDDFESAFTKLFDKQAKYVKKMDDVNSAIELGDIKRGNLILQTVRLYMEFVRLQGLISIFVWPRTIKDNAMRADIYTKIASRQIEIEHQIVTKFQELGYNLDDISRFISEATQGNLTLLAWSYDDYRKNGLGTEVRPLLDILWDMSNTLSPDILKRYQELYETNASDWREIAKLEKERLVAHQENGQS